MKAAGALNGNWHRGWEDGELDSSILPVPHVEQKSLEIRIDANLRMIDSGLPRTVEQAQARLDKLIPEYVDAFGHLGLVKFGYFNG